MRGNRLRRSNLPRVGVGTSALVGLMGLSGAAAALTGQSDGEGILAGADRPVAELSRPIAEYSRPVGTFDGAVTQREGDEVTVSLDADVLFDFDSDTLTPEAEQTLSDLADQLDEQLAGDTVTVVGHTDAKGEDAYNQDLSERRAEAVRAYLEPELSASPGFVVEGRGESEPVADNEQPDGSDDPEGRRRNRRVEITYQATPPEEG